MNIYIILALILFLNVIFWYGVSLVAKRMDVADIAWGIGFPLLGWSAFYLAGFSFRALLVNLLVSLWGLRLALHIYTRNHGKQEDPRYADWRKSWKNFYVRSFAQVFLLQGLLLYVIALPVMFINLASTPKIDYFVLFGVLIWQIGYYFEVVGDRQLATFIINPTNKGKIMQEGLWKYTRHPNYFGEVMMWWGIFVCGLGLPYSLFTILGPLTITYLIVFVSGIPLLEKRYLGNVDYEMYKQRTSVFFPFPPKT